MGVPKIFGWMIKKLGEKNILDSIKQNKIDHFYIDANCLIHPMCFTILEFYPNWTDKEKLEEKMIQRIISYIDYLRNIINPKQQFFISVDGVCPQAKAAQQRLRRFRSIDDALLRQSIKSSHGINSPNMWSNIVITPGTIFMEKLHLKLLHYVKSLKTTYSITYSSYHSVGEGEHKIINDIRQKNKSTNNKYCIYGLDADLLFLSFACQQNNIWLLREATEFGKVKTNIDFKKDDPIKDIQQELIYISIDTLKKNLFQYFNSHVNSVTQQNINYLTVNEFCNDFTLFCYLLGNDFIPNLPSLEISTGGLDLLISAYIDSFIKTGCVTTLFDKNNCINRIFFEYLLEYIANREDHYFKEIFPNYWSMQQKRKCPYTEQYKKEIWKIDNMIGIKIDDPVQLGKENYKYRYYDYYFERSTNYDILSNKVCEEYIKAIQWIKEYYFTGVISWNWKYPYFVAPFASDLLNYVKNNGSLNFIFNKSSPLLPIQQLLSVIPPSCYSLLPKNYQYLILDKNSPLIDYYPIKFKIDKINKLADFKCIPLIPQINSEQIVLYTKDLILTKDEQIRNNILDDFKFK